MTGSGTSAHAWAGSGEPERGGRQALMSIGEVLAHLRADFPDTTISKLRFLESEGLVEPRRTAAGYRKYTWADVARLRYVLSAQRDQYLPLRVIRERLAAVDAADGPEREPAGETRARPALVALPAEAGAGSQPGTEQLLSRGELLDRSGLADDALDDLEQHGLVAARPGGGYDADALEVARAAAQLAGYGLQARHLRAYRAAADREIGLFTQLVAPLARQSDPAGRARAAEAVRELAACTERLHAALVRSGLRETLGR